MLKRLKKLLRLEEQPGTPQDRAPDSARRNAEAAHGAGGTPAIHHGPKVVHQPIPAQDLDPDAVRIIQRLTRFDHTAYLVGGCVRDLLLERRPKDFDVGTTATPRQVKRAFRNCRIIGRRFRLAHIYFQSGKIIEVATFRARDLEGDGTGVDDRLGLLIRDDNVFGTPEEDALRRDFTINALFYDVNAGNVIDHADGLSDLRRRLVRTIGDPETRFREDPIRILRAIKFAARLGFTIEPATLEALHRTRGLIPEAASARVLEEIKRFCLAGAARRSFELMRETGVFEIIFPELAEAYADGRDAAALLDALLEEVDRRIVGGREPATGEIFAAVLLPVLGPRLGWTASGGAPPPRGLNIPAMVNEVLRPISVRLKLPRAEQERCRQILATLYRMVHPHRMKRSLRNALLRRPSFAEALSMLEVVARARGGDFKEAAEHWRSGAEDREERRPERPAGPAPAPTAVESPGLPRRRRRRRGGRSRGGEVPAEPRADRADPTKAGLPPPWDDNYFFAALPTVPHLEEVAPETRPDTETAAEVPLTAAVEPAAGTPTRAARRRRRRRRRGRRGGGSAPVASDRVAVDEAAEE